MGRTVAGHSGNVEIAIVPRISTYLDLGILPSGTDSSFFTRFNQLARRGFNFPQWFLGKTWMDNAIFFDLMHYLRPLAGWLQPV
jgi:hypothetical protein